MLRSLAIIALCTLVATLTFMSATTSRAEELRPAASALEATELERATTVSRSRPIAPAPEPTPQRTDAASHPAAAPAPASATTAPRAPVVPSLAEARAYAQAQIGAAQFACLDALWQHESNWNIAATNPSSGAYGIPQALPAGKLAAFGADWRTNPVTQVQWGLWYIKVSYGSACNAWSFWQRHYPHWY